MTVHHQPRTSGFSPLEVTYCWVEHRAEGDVERRHTEIVTSPEHEYVVHVAGLRDPTMKWVKMSLKNADSPKPGYSTATTVPARAGPRLCPNESREGSRTRSRKAERQNPTPAAI
jgi:hypothetical protein